MKEVTDKPFSFNYKGNFHWHELSGPSTGEPKQYTVTSLWSPEFGHGCREANQMVSKLIDRLID